MALKVVLQSKRNQAMKAVLTLIFIIVIGNLGLAQDIAKEVKVETIAKEVKLDITIKEEQVKKTEVARLYMNKNSRIKKALNFRTKSNRAKMA